MLDLLEKISAGVSVVGIVIVGVLYFIVPPRSTIPEEFRDRVVFTTALPVAQNPPAPGKAPQPTPPARGISDSQLRTKLRELGVRTVPQGAVERRSGKISPRTLDEISVKTNWMDEIYNAKSSIVRSRNRDTRLKLEWIAPNSYLGRLGLENGDTIDLIDGEIVEFNEESQEVYERMFEEKVRKLREGGLVSVTLTRNGRPLHLEFSLAGN